MPNPRVTSREYKVMLRTERFQADIEQASRNFWQEFRRAIKHTAVDSDGDFSITKNRTVRFYDTEGQRLRHHGYIFRERHGDDPDDRTVTLKFRHPDRYLAAGHDLTATSNGETKFEEDIKIPHQSLYSHSTKCKIDGGKNLNRMDDPGRLFPRLPAELRAYDPDERIGVVGEFLAQEVVLTGATFQIRKSPKVEAECAIVTWHDATGEQTTPVVAEFSFRYGDPDEDYSKKSVKRALDIFETLRSEPLSEWLGCQRMTKTAYVFSRSASGSG